MPKLRPEDCTIVGIGPEHSGLIESFCCGTKNEDDYLRKDALANRNFRLSETCLLLENGKLISYITLSVGSFDLSTNKRLLSVRIRDKPFRIYSKTMPCLLVGKLATDRGETGRGGATLLIDYAVKKLVEINEKIPVPFLALHAYPEKAGFYGRLGFEEARKGAKNSRTIAMYLEVK